MTQQNLRLQILIWLPVTVGHLVSLVWIGIFYASEPVKKNNNIKDVVKKHLAFSLRFKKNGISEFKNWLLMSYEDTHLFV